MNLKEETRAEPEDIEELDEGLVRIPLETPTLPPATRTNSFLVRAEGGWLLVEIGPSDPSELSRLADAIDEYVGEDELIGLFLTHHHPDHLSGLSWFIDNYDAPIFSGEATWSRHHHNVERRWEIVEGEEFDMFGLTFIQTDGHAPDHYSILLPNGHLVAGDIISGMGTIVIAPPDGDMNSYYDSLDRLIELDLEAIHPAHGPESTEPIRRLKAYRDHRKKREERVRKSLSEDEFRTVEQLLEVAYSDVDPSLHVFARGTLRAYLDMMHARGTVEVSEDGQRWRRTV
jgi:glyoxylase-like metal-dependent hydrolase (beta-lactamase superfamily II)